MKTLLILVSLCFVFMLDSFAKETSKIKNIIVMIGDGMGPQQVGLLDSYVRYSKNAKLKTTAFQRLSDEGVIGIVRTEPHDALVVDSAASASQFASGKMSGSEMTGADQHGNSVKTMLELAQEKGKAVGLVSDTRITHATPASYGAHIKHRKYENEIAQEMLSKNIDVMLAGGLRHWIPKSANDKKSSTYKMLRELTNNNIKIKSKRKDELNLLEQAKKQNYFLSFDKKSLKNTKSNKILGLYSYSGMNNGIINSNEKNYQPSLKQMTKKALNVLDKDKDGFFLMVESGQIDWAAHDNDTGTLLHEMIKFSNTIDYVMDWMKGRDDTILIVSADHETGGFGFAYSRNDLPKGKKLDGDLFNGEEFKPNWNFGKLSTLDKIYGQKKSYSDIFSIFKKLKKEEQTPKNLQKIVNENTMFPITIKDATRVLQTEENKYHVKGHYYLDSKTYPLIHDKEEFFVFGRELPRNILAMVTGKYSSTVWSTDNHTSTPVYLFAHGPKDKTEKFGTLQHSTQWAQKLIDILE